MLKNVIVLDKSIPIYSVHSNTTKMFKKNGRVIKCDRCRYEWTYGGKFNFYATCPSCRRNVRIEYNTVKLHP